MLVARLLSLLIAVLAAVLVMVPLPFSDLLIMIPAQLAIAFGSLLVTGRRLQFRSTLSFVLAYSMVGMVLVTILANGVLLLGKFVAAPFALLWCYALGEVTLARTRA